MRANTVFLLSLNWSCNRVFPAKMRFGFLQGFSVCFFKLLLFILRKVTKYLPLLVRGTIPPIGPIPSLQSSFRPFTGFTENKYSPWQKSKYFPRHVCCFFSKRWNRLPAYDHVSFGYRNIHIYLQIQIIFSALHMQESQIFV